METLEIPFLSGFVVHVGLFSDLKNASFIRQQLLSSNHDFEYAFIDATSVLSTKHVLAAVFRAINDAQNDRMKSKNVHSEIVFALGVNNNITDAFRQFGITDKTKALLAIKVGRVNDQKTSRESVTEHLTSNIEGELAPFSDDSLRGIADLTKIRKLYRVGPVQSGKGGRKLNGAHKAGHDVGAHGASSEAVERLELEAVVLGSIAMKGS